MLSFITFKDAPYQLEIIGDEKGLQQLMDYLEEIKKLKDHMHLVVGTELDQYPIYEDRKGKIISAKHVRLEYSETDSWKIKK